MKTRPQKPKIMLKDAFEVWEIGVPSHKIIQMENHLLKKEIIRVLLFKQPLNLLLCKGALTCSSISFESRILHYFVQNLLKEFDDE